MLLNKRFLLWLKARQLNYDKTYLLDFIEDINKLRKKYIMLNGLSYVYDEDDFDYYLMTQNYGYLPKLEKIY